MRAEFIEPTDQRWRTFLNRTPHDFYHLPEYVSFAAEAEAGEPLAFWAEAEGSAFLLPLLRRKLPEHLGAPSGWSDLSTPYGYPAPLLLGDAALWPHFLVRFVALGQEESAVAAFIRLHPLLAPPLLPADDLFALCSHGQTIYIDLTRSEAEISGQIRENHRRDIKKLRKAGFAVHLDAWDDLDRFVDLYHQTMARLQAESFYFFPYDYFHGLRTALADRLHLCSVRSPEDELVAGGLFVCTEGMIEYHLGGTAEKFLPQAPSKIMFDFVWRWGKETGCRLLHLGGGLGGRADSLCRFKEGFSRLRGEFGTLRIILDREKYRRLENKWRQSNSPGDAGESHYFPAYRRPVAVAEAETGASPFLTAPEEVIFQ